MACGTGRGTAACGIGCGGAFGAATGGGGPSRRIDRPRCGSGTACAEGSGIRAGGAFAAAGGFGGTAMGAGLT